MQVVAASNLDKPRSNIGHQPTHFLLAQSAFLLEILSEVTLITVLHDDVAVVGGRKHIIATQDVGVMKCLYGLDLRLQHFLGELIGKPLEFNDLNGDGLVFPNSNEYLCRRCDRGTLSRSNPSRCYR